MELSIIPLVLKLAKPVLDRFPQKEKIRGERVAEAEGRIESSEKIHAALERIGWNKDAAKIGATMEMLSNSANQNFMETMMKAESHSASPDFLKSLEERGLKDLSVIGPVIEASRFVGDEYLRDLLSRILAGDVDRPGSVSPITVSVAKNLNPEVLRKFLRLRAVSWMWVEVDGAPAPRPQSPFLLVQLGKGEAYMPNAFQMLHTKYGFSYMDRLSFESFGLICPPIYGGLGLEIENAKLSNRIREVELRSEGPRLLNLGVYGFTDAGSEIIGTYFNEEFDAIDSYFEEVCNHWRADGFDVEVSDNDRANNAPPT